MRSHQTRAVSSRWKRSADKSVSLSLGTTVERKTAKASAKFQSMMRACRCLTPFRRRTANTSAGHAAATARNGGVRSQRAALTATRRRARRRRSNCSRKPSSGSARSCRPQTARSRGGPHASLGGDARLGAAQGRARRPAPTEDGEVVFRHACKLGLEGIVSKRKGSPYRSGRSPDWLKMKNPAAPAVSRLRAPFGRPALPCRLPSPTELPCVATALIPSRSDALSCDPLLALKRMFVFEQLPERTENVKSLAMHWQRRHQLRHTMRRRARPRWRRSRRAGAEANSMRARQWRKDRASDAAR